MNPIDLLALAYGVKPEILGYNIFDLMTGWPRDAARAWNRAGVAYTILNVMDDERFARYMS